MGAVSAPCAGQGRARLPVPLNRICTAGRVPQIRVVYHVRPEAVPQTTLEMRTIENLLVGMPSARWSVEMVSLRDGPLVRGATDGPSSEGLGKKEEGKKKGNPQSVLLSGCPPCIRNPTAIRDVDDSK